MSIPNLEVNSTSKILVSQSQSLETTQAESSVILSVTGFISDQISFSEAEENGIGSRPTATTGVE